MTIQRLKDLIKRYDDDAIVEFNVQDNYSRYWEKATLATDSMQNNEWMGNSFKNGEQEYVNISLSLDNKDGKNPKITYRK